MLDGNPANINQMMSLFTHWPTVNAVTDYKLCKFSKCFY